MKRLLIAGAVFLLCGFSQVALASKATVTVTGTEQETSGGKFDNGSVTVTVNVSGTPYSETIAYGTFSSSASVASAIAARFSQDCNSPVIAYARGGTIAFETRDPAAAMAAVGATFAWDSTDFTASSFAMSTPPPSFTPTFSCSPLTIESGENVTCGVTLLAGAVSPVTFTVNGGSWTSATPNSLGLAVSNAALSETAAGNYTIAYNYPGDSSAGIPAASNTTTITVNTSGSGTTTPSGNTLYSFSITDQSGNSGYAANSNITAYSDSVNGQWSLGYDGLNRLISSQSNVGGLTQYGCWAYDSFGDMLTQGISSQAMTPVSGSPWCQAQSGATTWQNTYVYASNLNQITSGSWLDDNHHIHTQPPPTPPSTQSLLYDVAGDMTTDLINNYQYDSEGRVCAEQQVGGGTITGYLYDAEGNRVAKGTLSSMTCDPAQLQVTQTYFIGPDGAAMTEVDNDNNNAWARTEVSAVGQHLMTYTADGLHYQITDWLGTRRMEVNPGIGVEDNFTSWPSGDQFNSGTTLDASPRHFTGKERDQESGLDYFGARYYASSMGRFMSPDWTADPDPVPWADLENPQSLNLYSYVLNNPLSRTDPFGHAPDPCAGDPNCVTVTADEDGPPLIPLLRAGGHHFVDRSLIRARGAWNSLSGQFFRRWSTGKLPNPGQHTGYSTPHRLNSAQVRNIIDKVEKEVGKPMSKWDAEDIEKAVDEVKSAGGDTGAFLEHIAENNPTARTASADIQDVMSAAKSAMNSIRANAGAIEEDVKDAIVTCEEGGCPPP